jgi:hypothetical protein
MTRTDSDEVVALNWPLERRHEPHGVARVLWTLEKGVAEMQALLLDHGHLGAELKVLRDGEFVFGRRFDVPHLAIGESEALRETLSANGWTPASADSAR